MNIHRGIIAMAAPLLAASFLVVTTPPAQAATGSCTKAKLGKYKYKTGSKSFTWVVAQKDREENYSGRRATITFEASAGSTQTNHAKVNASLKGTVNAAWANFEASVGTEIGSATTQTKFSKVTRKYTLNSGDSYIFGQGTGRWTAKTTIYRCSKANANGDGYVWRVMGTASMRGHTGKTQAVVGCKQKPASSSFSYRLKKTSC